MPMTNKGAWLAGVLLLVFPTSDVRAQVSPRSLDVEDLNGAERRHARFVCIEVATSSDTQRAIDIVALLRRLFLTGPARPGTQTREPMLLNLPDTPSEIGS